MTYDPLSEVIDEPIEVDDTTVTKLHILKAVEKFDSLPGENTVEEKSRPEKITPSGDGDLSFTCPADDKLVVGCFSGLTIVAAKEFGIDLPSQLPAKFIDAYPGHSVYLHAMHSSVDWFAYAMWKDGKLQRSLSLSPDSGILENTGDRLTFEEPYWNGEHPALDPEEDDDDYPFPFHPRELGEAALLSLFGYQLEGFIDPTQLAPEKIPLMQFARKKSWWRF